MEQKRFKFTTNIKPDFCLGSLFITPNAFKVFTLDNFSTALERFIHSDWGNISDNDKKLNDIAVKNGNDMLMGCYSNDKGNEFYIKTEADRSVTTIYLAGED